MILSSSSIAFLLTDALGTAKVHHSPLMTGPAQFDSTDMNRLGVRHGARERSCGCHAHPALDPSPASPHALPKVAPFSGAKIAPIATRSPTVSEPCNRMLDPAVASIRCGRVPMPCWQADNQTCGNQVPGWSQWPLQPHVYCLCDPGLFGAFVPIWSANEELSRLQYLHQTSLTRQRHSDLRPGNPTRPNQGRHPPPMQTRRSPTPTATPLQQAWPSGTGP